jgi:hypothetical protein
MKKVARLPAMTTTATVGTDRVVRWIDVHPDYSALTEPGAILTVPRPRRRTSPAGCPGGKNASTR